MWNNKLLRQAMPAGTWVPCGLCCIFLKVNATNPDLLQITLKNKKKSFFHSTAFKQVLTKVKMLFTFVYNYTLLFPCHTFCSYYHSSPIFHPFHQLPSLNSPLSSFIFSLCHTAEDGGKKTIHSMGQTAQRIN